MDSSFLSVLMASHRESKPCPPVVRVSSFFESLLGVLFPEHSHQSFNDQAALGEAVSALQRELSVLIEYCPAQDRSSAERASSLFFEGLDDLYYKLQEDVEAMFAGDPAATSRAEVVRSYPGFFAIAAYRVAHGLLTLKINQMPRMITEYAHSKTGIDIHPGAKIGRSFCIDHGTGIVIGETAVIGDRVKLYQGVTLGALSVSKADAANKRHPSLEDDVVVYAGATILGGQTVIGSKSIIGGNVWLTRSVPSGSKIYYQAKMHNMDTGETDILLFKSGEEA